MSEPSQMKAPEYLHLLPNGPFLQLKNVPSKAVLVIESEVALDWEEQVCEWLVKSCCLYAITWGTGCNRWHDSIDLANIKKFKGKEIPEDGFVMTTWHDDPLQEAFWFCGNCAVHPTVEIEKVYIVHIAQTARGSDLIAQYEAAQVETD